MIPNDGEAFRRSMVRMTYIMASLIAAGVAYLLFARGVRDAASFLLGGAVSWLSFWRWRKVVESLGSETSKSGSFRWILRFALLAAVAYVIVKYLEVNLVAALVGLLVAAAAVVFEIIFQLTVPGA